MDQDKTNTTPEEQWHLKKEVNITHLFATVGLVVSAFMYSTALDKRIQANEKDISHIKSQRVEDTARVEKKFDVINQKLDKILEQGINNN
tara:strand:- start:2412 stop:2681 length:270 start_codon:yes stop_codon:yes gene_type:complete